ncbi:hypothetical protein F5878DRAFT_647344 [Lentinula raphanica]|uniref:Uncharacterized protein n=1 Tax=Lentinula raphanica TaxID=153919 RepID=A0AA38NWE6_9AGAR|nr:hypothetical protein F5880DRAFT_1511677 [Lentinula raphanica]KAJ3831786.1 hypothetical protein F5878DRAFT_647344 [Lentinula raphanica]
MSVEPSAPASPAPTPPAPPFFLQALAEVATDWDKQYFKITRRSNPEPLNVSFEEMIECVLASLALGRRWKMEKGLPDRYEEIVRTLFAYIPSTSPANFSIAANGTVEKTESPVTYECIFTAEQIKILVELEAISGNVFVDVKKAYPKPSRAQGGRNEELRKLLDVHHFDQGI